MNLRLRQRDCLRRRLHTHVIAAAIGCYFTAVSRQAILRAGKTHARCFS
jgi:hypothetical protein